MLTMNRQSLRRNYDSKEAAGFRCIGSRCRRTSGAGSVHGWQRISAIPGGRGAWRAHLNRRMLLLEASSLSSLAWLR